MLKEKKENKKNILLCEELNGQSKVGERLQTKVQSELVYVWFVYKYTQKLSTNLFV